MKGGMMGGDASMVGWPSTSDIRVSTSYHHNRYIDLRLLQGRSQIHTLGCEYCRLLSKKTNTLKDLIAVRKQQQEQ